MLQQQVERTALLSVYDKTGLLEFTQELRALGFNFLASAGTAKYLNDNGIKARDVAEIVGSPILGHRVVTLSREIHAALLATNSAADTAELERLGIPRIDLVYVNLYPLEQELADPRHTLESVIEKTDIGGPTLLRSAAKGRRLVMAGKQGIEVTLKFLKGGFENSPEAESAVLSYLASQVEYQIADYCLKSGSFHFGQAETAETKKHITGLTFF